MVSKVLKALSNFNSANMHISNFGYKILLKHFLHDPGAQTRLDEFKTSKLADYMHSDVKE